MTKQTARYSWNAQRGRGKVTFYRLGRYLFEHDFTSRHELQEAVNLWENGATQADMINKLMG